MSDNQNNEQMPRIKVSHQAYSKLKELATQDKYRSRGMVGVIDDLLIGRFTTEGSGRGKKS